MIEFPCRCGNLFHLEDDEAGSSVQCRKCGLLNDVPLLGDMHALAEDGTYKLDDAPAQFRGTVLQDLSRSFSIDGTDAQGAEIDLRVSPEQIAALSAPSESKPFAPRYDPETGELIRPIELTTPARTAPLNADIPFAQPALTYSTTRRGPSESWRGSLQALFSPVNVLVMMIVLLVQLVVSALSVFTIAGGIMIATVGMFVVQLLLIAHFGNVIDEVGVEQRDDLPRLFRDLQFHEDIWSPLIGMLGGVFLCYAPALVCLMATTMDRSTFLSFSDVLLLLSAGIGVCIVITSVLSDGVSNIDWMGQVALPLAGLLIALVVTFAPAGICLAAGAGSGAFIALAALMALAGTFFFPGVTLTMTTSGSVLNLRPDRLFKTIATCGPRYASPLLAWVIAAAAYGMGEAILTIGITKTVTGWGSGTWMDNTLIGYPFLCLGLLTMHFFSFELGMLYRRHHAGFPWLFQRHIPVQHTGRAAAIRSATRARSSHLLRK